MFPKVARIISTAVFTNIDLIYQKSPIFLGYFCKQICGRALSKFSQSGHGGSDWLILFCVTIFWHQWYEAFNKADHLNKMSFVRWVKVSLNKKCCLWYCSLLKHSGELFHRFSSRPALQRVVRVRLVPVVHLLADDDTFRRQLWRRFRRVFVFRRLPRRSWRDSFPGLVKVARLGLALRHRQIGRREAWNFNISLIMILLWKGHDDVYHLDK